MGVKKRHTPERLSRQPCRLEIAHGIEVVAGNGRRLRKDRRWSSTQTDRVSARPKLGIDQITLVRKRKSKRTPSMNTNSPKCVKDHPSNLSDAEACSQRHPNTRQDCLDDPAWLRLRVIRPTTMAELSSISHLYRARLPDSSSLYVRQRLVSRRRTSLDSRFCHCCQLSM